MLHTLAQFSAEPHPDPGLVIGYGAIPTERVEEGLKRLAATFRSRKK